ncbi:MAG: ribosome small subunit-dependent GTPase A [Bacteroidales bacterium]|nr:ribosome small subunit-dependent GTPase A [Bacteroidales bacterium]
MNIQNKKKSTKKVFAKTDRLINNNDQENFLLNDSENIGRVITSTGSFYIVKTKQGESINCVVKGKFRIAGIKTTNPVAVGDMVHFIKLDGNEFAQIDYIFERKNYIIRKSVNLSKLYSIVASNIDMAFLIISCKQPRTDTMFIDRFLVTADAYNVPCTIVINKTDIYDEDSQMYAAYLTDIYENIGYEVLFTSASNGIGINQLKERLKSRICLFSGNSGVGKSTLINLICPEAKQKTAEISSAHDSGKHTTTFATMIQHDDINIIDTPGVKSFGMVEFKKEELALYFPEMKECLKDCKYYNCTHTHEPGCAIKQAVENGTISHERYNNYIKLLNADDMN